MLRCTQVFRKVNLFGLFMRDNKGNKALKNLPILKRGKALAKLYYALTPIQVAALSKRAAVTTFPRRKKADRIVKRKTPKPTKYTKFFAKWSKQLTGPSRDRVKQIAKLWKKEKKSQKK
ncbi:kinetoplast DNA-associated protein, putative [Bodo saltans]|uniref:Kinetoplast DNA-associated protein, putative n=1 Tax=Bodo saltans TaxID=75058 RepID=A0A0S4J9G1_BODSA|nr:kinetoplast DNA-associated protein, putative [Bodo saltans]|eukprot:CUG85601.1 kinetoplast DNA-associated protein, putative [Bodo saltans]